VALDAHDVLALLLGHHRHLVAQVASDDASAQLDVGALQDADFVPACGMDDRRTQDPVQSTAGP
jgi:hypothetical protein